MGNNNSQLKFKKSTRKETEWVICDDEDGEFENDFIDRQHMQHFIRKYLFQGNFSAPIEEKLIQGCRVLDVGCGPGTWLLDIANKYKNSQFYGLDIKPFFPQKIKPSNLKFVKADLFDGLPFRDNEFDFVHMEMMCVCFKRDQWDFAFSELIRVVKPGGYIESTESLHVEINKNLLANRMQEALYRFFLKQNIDLKLLSNIDSILESQQNIGKVHQETRSFIFGPNGGKVGLAYQDVLYSYYSGKSGIKIFTDELGVSEEDYKIMLEKGIKEELKQFKIGGLLARSWTQKISNE